MSGLININQRKFGDQPIETVSARELHSFLECKEEFAHWIKQRIEQYGFVGGVDFTTYRENPQKGRPRIEYALSLDMAKELAMVERNEKGKQARQYFIECERVAKAAPLVDDRKRLRHEAAASYKVMSQVLAMSREAEGKKTAPHHFMNEARMVNQALTGEFKSLDRDQLSIEQLDALAAAEVRNAVLIATGHQYQDRKVQVQAVVGMALQAAKANPQLGGAK